MTGRPGRRPPARITPFAVLVVLAALLVAVGGMVVIARGPGAAPSVPPTGSPATPVIHPSATTQSGPTLVEVPASVDATGETDVTDALQAVIDAAPDGALIRLGAGARYRIEAALELQQRRDLLIDGRGATIVLVEGERTRRRHLWLVDSTSIEIRDLTLVGSNPDPGVLDEARQFEHGLWIDGGGAITVTGVTIDNPRGDCVYLGDRDGRLGWVDGFTLRDSACHGTGRNGVSIVAGRNVRIEDNTFGLIGLHAIDIEPNQADVVQGADRVVVTGNRVDGPVDDYFFAANGWGPIDNLTVTDNVLEGVALRITVRPLEGSGYVRRAVRVSGNRSDTPYAGEGSAALSFRAVIGLTVTGNTVPLEGDGALLAKVDESCQVSIFANSFPGGTTEWRGAPGPCPVPRQ